MIPASFFVWIIRGSSWVPGGVGWSQGVIRGIVAHGFLIYSAILAQLFQQLVSLHRSHSKLLFYILPGCFSLRFDEAVYISPPSVFAGANSFNPSSIMTSNTKLSWQAVGIFRLLVGILAKIVAIFRCNLTSSRIIWYFVGKQGGGCRRYERRGII